MSSPERHYRALDPFEFYEESCGTCNSTGYRIELHSDYDDYDDPCPACGGTGIQLSDSGHDFIAFLKRHAPEWLADVVLHAKVTTR